MQNFTIYPTDNNVDNNCYNNVNFIKLGLKLDYFCKKKLQFTILQLKKNYNVLLILPIKSYNEKLLS